MALNKYSIGSKINGFQDITIIMSGISISTKAITKLDWSVGNETTNKYGTDYKPLFYGDKPITYEGSIEMYKEFRDELLSVTKSRLTSSPQAQSLSDIPPLNLQINFGNNKTTETLIQVRFNGQDKISTSQGNDEIKVSCNFVFLDYKVTSAQ